MAIYSVLTVIIQNLSIHIHRFSGRFCVGPAVSRSSQYPTRVAAALRALQARDHPMVSRLWHSRDTTPVFAPPHVLARKSLVTVTFCNERSALPLALCGGPRARKPRHDSHAVPRLAQRVRALAYCSGARGTTPLFAPSHRLALKSFVAVSFCNDRSALPCTLCGGPRARKPRRDSHSVPRLAQCVHARMLCSAAP